MLDREVFSCIPFQLVSSQICLSLSFARKRFFPICKNFFWNWSWSSAVKILLPRTISFVYRLYLFCNICQKYFFDSFFLIRSSKPIQLVSVFIGCTQLRTCCVLTELWRFVTLMSGSMFWKSEAVWSTAGNCDAEDWANLSRAFMMLLQMSS